MKKAIIPVLSVLLALSLVATVSAGFYFSKQARMQLFSGSIEQANVKPGDPMLTLKVADIDIGQDGDISNYNGAVFPILSNVEGQFTGEDLSTVNWSDENGRTPISAPKFVISAKNGKVEDVQFKVLVQGNDKIAPALKFGVVTTYYSEAEGGKVALCQTVSIDPGSTESELTEIGDGNIAEGEEVEVSVVAWVDSYALSNIGYYDDISFAASVIFVAP